MSQTTCGEGLADYSVLPEKLGLLVDSLAATLEAHQRTLDLDDESSSRENAAYGGLATEFRDIATKLQLVAKQMAAYRDLPMGKHDQSALLDPKTTGAFAQFVDREREALLLLQRSLLHDEKMLADINEMTKGHTAVG